jgi:hypothetical protein
MAAPASVMSEGVTPMPLFGGPTPMLNRASIASAAAAALASGTPGPLGSFSFGACRKKQQTYF